MLGRGGEPVSRGAIKGTASVLALWSSADRSVAQTCPEHFICLLMKWC